MRIPFIAVMVLAAALAAPAQKTVPPRADTDQHLAQDADKQLFLRAPFAHGYLHGYDEGFYQGDLDYQLGRDRRDFSADKLYRAALPDNYRPLDRGVRDQFRDGYRQGYLAGYFDSFAGRSYRGFGQVAVAAAGLPDDDDPNPGFADGLRKGYLSAFQRGRLDAISDADYNVPEPPCTARDPQYCAGYMRGLAMGYPDGYLETLDVPPSPRELRALQATGTQTASSEPKH